MTMVSKLFTTHKRYLILWVVLCSCIGFIPLFRNGFIVWDDLDYILNNPLIKTLSFKHLLHIFSDNFLGNYHPFTLLSFSFDYLLFGANPTGYHLHNLLLHLVNSFLLYHLLYRLFNRKMLAFLTALLFFIHPMHVESIAWASERKDLLYSLYYLLSLIFYVQYRKTNRFKHLVFSLFFFIFSLLSKGQAVSLFFVILLIDYYLHYPGSKKRLIIEKIPYLILSLLFGIIAINAQTHEGEINTWVHFSFFERVTLAAYSFSSYIFKLLIPFKLSALHPYPHKINNVLPLFYYAFHLVTIATVVLLVYLVKTRKRKYVFAILFFIVNLIFVLQLIPVGDAIISERYSYLSSVGLFLIIAFFLEKYFVSAGSLFPKIMIAAIVLYFSFMVVITYNRMSVWKSSLILFNDILEKYPDSEIALNNRASIRINRGEFDEALQDLNKSISFDSTYFQAIYNRAIVKRKKDDMYGSLLDYNRVLRLNPDFVDALYNRGNINKDLHSYTEAISDYTKVIAKQPSYWQAYNNRALCKIAIKDYPSAIKDLTITIDINPDCAAAFYLRGLAEAQSGDDGCDDFITAYKKGNTNAQTAIMEYCR